MPKKPSALVLSGGGALGVAQVGILRHLEKEYSFDFLCGTSAGSIVASAVACGKSADDISDIIHNQNFFELLFDFSKGGYGLLKAQKVLDFLESVYDGRTFADLEDGKKLFVFATDFHNGEQVIIHQGSVARAVRASISIPVVFEPFLHNGRWLVDGGLVQNFPLDYAIENYTGNAIIGIDVITRVDGDIDFSQELQGGLTKRMQNALERTLRIIYKNQQKYLSQDDRVDIYQPNLSGYRTSDIDKLREIEYIGEKCFLDSERSIKN